MPTEFRSGPPLGRLLAQRLLLIAGIVFLLNSVAVGIYYGSDKRALETEVVSEQAEEFEGALSKGLLPHDAKVRRLFADHPSSYAFALVDRSGRVLDSMNSDLIPPGAKDLYADDWMTRMVGTNAPLLVAGHEFAGRNDGLRMVFVMRDDPARLLWRAYLAEFYQHVWLPILPLVIVLAATNFLLIRRGLAPVAAAAEWARNLRPGSPTPPPGGALPAEIADLVQATERSVERLAQALETEKRHSAEAAHALRTPVAVLMARMDSLPPSDATEKIRSDLSNLSRTVQQVLASSRAERASGAATTLVDLKALVQDVVATLASFAYSRGAELSLVMPEDEVTVRADPEGIEMALSNLLENAVIHGGPGLVEVSLEPGPSLTIRDHGPGLPDGSEGNLFKPFWRGSDATPGGAGLGLAIVDRVQRAVGAKVEARNAEGGGAEFKLTWPARNF